MCLVKILDRALAWVRGAPHVARELPVHRDHVDRLDHCLQGPGIDAVGLELNAHPALPESAREVANRLRLEQGLAAREAGEAVRPHLERVGGWQVSVVSSGEEALERAATERPDLILLDVMMPGMDGLATLGRLRACLATAQIPVILLTARAQSHEVEGYLKLGATGVIRKPFDPLTLPEDIRRIVRVGRAGSVG